MHHAMGSLYFADVDESILDIHHDHLVHHAVDLFVHGDGIGNIEEKCLGRQNILRW